MQQMMISQSVERLSIANTSLLIHIVPSPSPQKTFCPLMEIVQYLCLPSMAKNYVRIYSCAEGRYKPVRISGLTAKGG